MTDLPDSDTKRSPVGLIIGAVIVLVVAIVAGGIYLSSKGGDKASSTSSSQSDSSAAAPSVPVDPTAEGFGTPRADALGRKVDVPRNGLGVILPQATDQQKPFGDPAALTTPAAGIRWQQTAGVVTPFSTSDGPTRMDGQVPVGFAHTPAGAALAAASGMYRILDGRLAKETIEKSLDPSAKTYKAAQEKAETMPPDATVGDKMPRPVGYDLKNCDPTYCLVELGIRLPNGETSMNPMAVVWVDGDWKLTYSEAQRRVGTDTGAVQW